MRQGQPSQTAQGAAIYRAVHQMLEGGAIFKDPFTSRIVDKQAAVSLNEMPADQSLRPMRLFISARRLLSRLFVFRLLFEQSICPGGGLSWQNSTFVW